MWPIASGEINVIDTVTNTIVNTINLGGIGYQGMVFNADGTRLYLINEEGITLVMDSSTNTEITKLLVSPVNGNPILSSDGTALYSTGVTCAISRMDISTNKWVESLLGVMQGGCGGIAIHPSRERYYISNAGAYTLSVINRSGNPVAIIPVGGRPGGLVIKP
jgi:DNA-binding beta-propeller fold protein YncE